MKTKTKNKKNKKTSLEKQCEELFSKFKINTLIKTETTSKKPTQQLQTWVTYSAFEDPIV